MATVDKDAAREANEDAQRRDDERAERRDRFVSDTADAAARLDSPSYATGPGFVPAAGGDVDSLLSRDKHDTAGADPVLEANRASGGRDDWEETVYGKASKPRKADSDESDEDRAKREAAEKRSAAANESGEGAAATVSGRRQAPKSTT